MGVGDLLVGVVREGLVVNHRRLLVVCGGDGFGVIGCLCGLLGSVLRFLLDVRGRIGVLYGFCGVYGDALERLRLFRDWIGGFGGVDFVAVDFRDSESVLGLTFDVAVLDLFNDLNPNDIGRLVGIVRGGGLIVFLAPSLDIWPKMVTRFRRELATIQYPVSRVRNVFVRRFIWKLMSYPGIGIYDCDREEWIKKFRLIGVRGRAPRNRMRRDLKIPSKTSFSVKVYRLALTQDQIEVLRLFEKLIDRPRGRRALVITADRGRGKSCSVGIGLVALGRAISLRKTPVKILVTAPSLLSIQPLMELAHKTLRTLGYRNINTIKRGNKIARIETKSIIIEYREPLDAVTRRADVIAVDEAAGIQVPMLHAIWRHFRRLVFSSTIHGYEGAGRGFSIRFLKALREDPKTEVIEYEMTEPIRYARDDPIEKWLFDTLMLDAEPAEITSEDLKYIDKLDLKYVKLDLEELFLKNDDLLRQFIGIYVLAHYRNQPKDLAMIADAPHHEIRALMTPTGKVVCSIELAEEGPIPESIGRELLLGAKVQGNIIPDRFIKHFRALEFGKYVGWRIVRIATHINLMGRGIGSKMLSEVCREAVKRGYDWIGAGFGVSEKLLKFWIKNGFIPVHISPDRNPISGEYTVLVIKPLKPEVEEHIIEANREFRRRLIGSLHDTYRDLEPEVAYLLLKPWRKPVEEEVEPRLSKVQVERVRVYSYGPMTLEGVVDAVHELAKCYFYDINGRRPKLDKKQKLLLITKVLQARPWSEVCKILDTYPPIVMAELRTITKKLLEHYCKTPPLTGYEEF